MKNLGTVIVFSIKDMLSRKSFIISTLIILILIVIGFNVPNIINTITGDSGTSNDTNLLIVDYDNLFEGMLPTLNSMELGYNIEVANNEVSFEDIKSRIDNKDIDEAMIIEKQEDGTYAMTYIVENTTQVSSVPEELLEALNTIYMNLQMSKLGLTQEQIASLSLNYEFTITQTDEQEVSGNLMVILILSILLFYAIYFCAYQVSSSITTEKTSKIMETLVTSTSPRTIILGKTIGIGLVGLIQICLIVAVALMSANAFLEPEILDEILDMSMMTPYLAIMTIIYFILGYAAYALLYALTGSTVSKPEEIQSANTPVAILTVIGFYLSYFTMMNPTSELNQFAAIFPISSPFCMPFRIMMGIASNTEVILSIVVLIITILVIAQVAIKIYSNAILNYGTRMTFKDIVKVYRDKNN